MDNPSSKFYFFVLKSKIAFLVIPSANSIVSLYPPFRNARAIRSLGVGHRIPK